MRPLYSMYLPAPTGLPDLPGLPRRKTTGLLIPRSVKLLPYVMLPAPAEANCYVPEHW